MDIASTTTLLFIILGVVLATITTLVLRLRLRPLKVSKLQSLINHGRYDAAIKAAKVMLRKSPRNVTVRFLLGKTYIAINQHKQALAELRLINKFGNFAPHLDEREFRATMASLFNSLNQPEEALKEYLLLTQLDPSNPNYNYRVGSIFRSLGKHQSALKFLYKAIELDGNHPEALFEAADVLFHMKKYGDSKRFVATSIANNSSNYKAHFLMGRLLKLEGNHLAAISYLEKAQKDPDLKADALVELGECKIHYGGKESAISTFVRALSLLKDEESMMLQHARYLLADCYEHTRDLSGALSLWEKIQASRPNFRDVTEKLAQYSELRTSDYIKDYLTCGIKDFDRLTIELTKKMGLYVREHSRISGGCQVIGTSSNKKWASATGNRPDACVWFLRTTDMLPESVTRAMYETMKNTSCGRGIIYSCSKFSEQAIKFSEARPIELYGSNKLLEMLRSLDQNESTHKGNKSG